MVISESLSTTPFIVALPTDLNTLWLTPMIHCSDLIVLHTVIIQQILHMVITGNHSCTRVLYSEACSLLFLLCWEVLCQIAYPPTLLAFPTLSSVTHWYCVSNPESLSCIQSITIGRESTRVNSHQYS